LGTDMHFQEQLFPRFGTWACLGKHADIMANNPDTKRSNKADDRQSGYDVRKDAEAQDLAVTYNTPARTFYNTRFKRPNVPPLLGTNGEYFDNHIRARSYTQYEAAALQALILVNSKHNPTGKEAQKYTHNDAWGDYSLDIGRMEQFAIGFAQ